MAERPEPYQELNWEPARARAFGDRVLDLWEEFLAKLPDLPVTSRQFTEKAVHDAVVIPVPDEPLSEDELVDYIRSIWFEHSMYPGHPRFSAYITAAGTVLPVCGQARPPWGRNPASARTLECIRPGPEGPADRC